MANGEYSPFDAGCDTAVALLAGLKGDRYRHLRQRSASPCICLRLAFEVIRCNKKSVQGRYPLVFQCLSCLTRLRVRRLCCRNSRGVCGRCLGDLPPHLVHIKLSPVAMLNTSHIRGIHTSVLLIVLLSMCLCCAFYFTCGRPSATSSGRCPWFTSIAISTRGTSTSGKSAHTAPPSSG